MPSALNRYSFINAKLKTRMDFLLKEAFFQKLKDRPNLNEAMLMLKSTPYGMMEEVYEQTGDLKMAEKTLKEYEIDSFRELKKHCDETLQGFLDVLLLKYDIEILKDWIRLWFDLRIRKRDVSDLMPYMLRTVVHTDFDPDTLLTKETTEQLYGYLASCRGCPLSDLFQDRIEAESDLDTLYGLEKDLDHFRFAKILEYAGSFPEPDRSLLIRYTAMEIDFENMLFVIRMSPLLPLEQLFEDLIPGGTVFAGTSARTADQYLEKTLGSYGSMGSVLLGEGGDPLKKMEMLSALFGDIEDREIKKMLQGNPFTLGIMLAWFMRKERECRRLVSLLNAAHYKANSMDRGNS